MAKLTAFEKAWGGLTPSERLIYRKAYSDQYVKTQQRMGKAHPDVYAERQKTLRKLAELEHPITKGKLASDTTHSEAYKTSSKAQLLGAKVSAVQTGMNIWNQKGALLIWVIVLIILIGPGINAILLVMGGMNLWYWLGAIVLGLIAWRNL